MLTLLILFSWSTEIEPFIIITQISSEQTDIRHINLFLVFIDLNWLISCKEILRGRFQYKWIGFRSSVFSSVAWLCSGSWTHVLLPHQGPGSPQPEMWSRGIFLQGKWSEVGKTLPRRDFLVLWALSLGGSSTSSVALLLQPSVTRSGCVRTPKPPVCSSSESFQHLHS